MDKPAAKPGIPCPPEVLTLVVRYDRNRDDYRSGQYNEARLRQEFLVLGLKLHAAESHG